jgi:hypothetical protein
MRESKYQDRFCEEVIRLGKEGKSKAQMAAELGVSSAALPYWAQDPTKAEFKEALDYAVTCSQAYWEILGMQGIKGVLPKFNAPSWIFSMKARFKDYKDIDNQKIELSNSIKGMTDTEIDETINALVAKKAMNTTDSSSGSAAQVDV